MSGLSLLLANLVVFCVRFAIFVGLTRLLTRFGAALRLLRRSQLEQPSPGVRIREFGWSLMSASIFVGAMALLLAAAARGYSRIYLHLDDFGIGWFVASVCLAIAIHDAYFYWTHRWMHHTRLIWRSHRLHHEFRNPTAWSAFSFHPIEAVIAAGILPVLAWSIPMHPLAFFAFTTIMTVQSVAIHSGFELEPGLRRRISTEWIWLGARAHNQHHQGVTANFGLYTPWWDVAMGTYVGPARPDGIAQGAPFTGDRRTTSAEPGTMEHHSPPRVHTR